MQFLRTCLLFLILLLPADQCASAKIKPDDTTNIHRLLAAAAQDQQQNNLASAEAKYRKALSINPNSFDAYYGLATVLDARGMPEEAEKLYRAAMQRNPNHTSSFFRLGAMAYEKENFKKAAEYFERVTFIEPEMVAGHYNLGLSYLKCKKYEKARQAFKKVLNLSPNNAMTYVNIGESYEWQGFSRDAELAYRDALRCAPDLAVARERLDNLRARAEILENKVTERPAALSLLGNNSANLGFQANNPQNSFTDLNNLGSAGQTLNSKSVLMQAGASLVQQILQARSQDLNDQNSQN